MPLKTRWGMGRKWDPWEVYLEDADIELYPILSPLSSQLTTPSPSPQKHKVLMFQKNKIRKTPSLGKQGMVEGRGEALGWKPSASWTVETPTPAPALQPHNTSPQRVYLWGNTNRRQYGSLLQLVIWFWPCTPREAQHLRRPSHAGSTLCLSSSHFHTRGQTRLRMFEIFALNLCPAPNVQCVTVEG